MEKTIKIGGELESVATGGIVAAASAIKDKAKGKFQGEINAEVDASLEDRYTKEETYSKQELNSLITTPSTNYEAVEATEETTDVTDVLPATGEADTIYRVGSWDGSQYDATSYSEYAWKGNAYVHLSTKPQIGEVFDISAYRATGGTLAKYADLAAALDGGNNVPSGLRKGGMSVKFVQSSDNKYVQYMLVANQWSNNISDWQKINDVVSCYKEVNFHSNQSMYNWFKTNIIGIYFSPDRSKTLVDGVEYICSYIGINNSYGNNALGINLKCVDTENTEVFHVAFYLPNSNNLQPHSTYQLLPYGAGHPEQYGDVYIRTADNFTWTTDSALISHPFDFVNFGIGKDVIPFINSAITPIYTQIEENSQAISQVIENNPKTYVIVNIPSGFTREIIKLIQEIYVETDLDLEGYKLIVKYIALNSSSLGGNNFYAIQLAALNPTTGTTMYESSFIGRGSSWKAGVLYQLYNYGASGVLNNRARVYIRTSLNFSWPSETYFGGGTNYPLELTANGYGKNVIPYIMLSQQQTYRIIDATDIDLNILNLIKDFFIVGDLSIPDDKKVVITYIGFNSNNLGGEGKFGVQVALLDMYAQYSEQTNIEWDASTYNSDTLYKGTITSGGNSIFGNCSFFIRTASNFSWTSSVVLKNNNPTLELLPACYGENIMPFIISSENRTPVLTVGKSSDFDFQSVTEAVAAANDGDTIIVYPGIYSNEVIVAKNKTVYIIGIDRDSCIIKNNYGEYYRPPMEMASGLLRNLTIIQEKDTLDQYGLGAYAVHLDFNYMKDKTIRIENCTLQSNSPLAGAIGVGLRGGCTLTLKGCHLISGTSNRAIVVHDNNNSEEYDGLQCFHAEDTIFETVSSEQVAVHIQGQGNPNRTFEDSQFYIRFNTCTIYGTLLFNNYYNDAVVTADDFEGVQNLRLDKLSYGNNKSELNAL